MLWQDFESQTQTQSSILEMMMILLFLILELCVVEFQYFLILEFRFNVFTHKKQNFERFGRLVIFRQQIHKIQSTVMLVFLWYWSIINVSVLSLSHSLHVSLHLVSSILSSFFVMVIRLVSPWLHSHSVLIYFKLKWKMFPKFVVYLSFSLSLSMCLWKERPVSLSTKCCSLPLFFQVLFPRSLSLTLSPSFFPSSNFDFDLTVNQHRFRCYQNPGKIFTTWIMIHTWERKRKRENNEADPSCCCQISSHITTIFSIPSRQKRKKKERMKRKKKEEERKKEDDGMMKNKKTESHFHKLDSVFLPSWNLKLSTLRYSCIIILHFFLAYKTFVLSHTVCEFL